MEFLKEIFGDKALTYDDLAAALKDNQDIVLGNLAGGAYVGKEKFDAKDRDLAAKVKELEKANELIANLKKANAGDEDLQGKIATYETTVATLQKELEETKVDAALKVALLEAKALDVDYISFKIKNGDGEIALDEHGKIKGIEETIESMKKQYPTQFAVQQSRQIEPNHLPEGEGTNGGMTKKELLSKPYEERSRIYQEDPQKFQSIMKSEE